MVDEFCKLLIGKPGLLKPLDVLVGVVPFELRMDQCVKVAVLKLDCRIEPETGDCFGCSVNNFLPMVDRTVVVVREFEDEKRLSHGPKCLLID